MDNADQTPPGAAAASPPDAPAGLLVCPLPDRAGARAAGEINVTTRAAWEHALEHAVREGGDEYYMELSAVTFVDVAGVTALAMAARRLGEGQRIVLHRPPATLSRVLDMFWPDLSTIEVSAS
ncbi:STAS domain-containing protein [Streptomyces sp. NPDC008313]|uniref:STAS domain-containing protein n=1 Tax=Streptomyces sp. NPDC008313 TaxID=3364826 RepID=UPI0036E72D49